MKSKHPRRPRIATVATSACLVALSIGAPNACMDVNPPDVAKQGSGTWADPTIVSRDNLAIGGQLDVKDPTVRGSVSSPFLSDGTWAHLSGHFTIDEVRDKGWHYTYQYTPLLPSKPFTGPGVASYGTRAGSMVHGNRYRVSINGRSDSGESFQLSNTQTVMLSDDVALVPVVVISWKNPKGLPNDSFIDETFRARKLFDFNPVATYWAGAPTSYFRSNGTEMKPLPLLVKDGLTASVPSLTNFDTPDPKAFSPAPDFEELPPDEIWQTCGVQFQVVAQFTFTLPDGWTPKCNTQALNLPNPEWQVKSALAGNPTLRDYLTNDLKPIYVSYADLADCATGWGSNSFVGTTPGKGRFIEINFRRHRNTTAHELGHALGLDHAEVAGSPVEGNLMRVNPVKETALTKAQCDAARVRAGQLSRQYDYFNEVTGRTYSDAVPPPPSGGMTTDDSGTTIGSGGGGSAEICCKPKDASDVSWSSPAACTGTKMDDSMCTIVCCGTKANKLSGYLCKQQGGTQVPCAN